MSNFDVMIARRESAPDEKRLLLDSPTFEQLVTAALNKFLQMGAMLTKDAAVKGRSTLQYAPTALQSFLPLNTSDANGETVPKQGPYIVVLCAEAQPFRFSTSGRQPTPTFGMLVPVGTFVEMTLHDLTTLSVCPTAAGSIINMEVYQVDA